MAVTKTQPFSVRLRHAADLLVREEMRRSGRSRSAIVEELAEEAAKMRLFPGIGFRDSPRRAWVIGTGLDVWQVIEMYRDYGSDIKRVVESHGLLTERAVRLALAYTERFPEEIEEAIQDNNRPVAELLELYPFIEVVTIDDE